MGERGRQRRPASQRGQAGVRAGLERRGSPCVQEPDGSTYAVSLG